MTAEHRLPRLSDREKGLLSIGGFIIAISLYFSYVGAPMIQDFFGSRDRVNTLETRLASSANRRTTAEKLQAEIRGWESAGIKLEPSPPGESTVMAAGNVVELARRSNCELKEAVPLKTVMVEGAVAVPVKFQFEADIGSVAGFIKSVEEHSPPMVFSNITIVPGEGSTLKLSGQIRCYTGEGGAANGS